MKLLFRCSIHLVLRDRMIPGPAQYDGWRRASWLRLWRRTRSADRYIQRRRLLVRLQIPHLRIASDYRQWVWTWYHRAVCIDRHLWHSGTVMIAAPPPPLAGNGRSGADWAANPEVIAEYRAQDDVKQRSPAASSHSPRDLWTGDRRVLCWLIDRWARDWRMVADELCAFFSENFLKEIVHL